ncbi:hemagglutinin repeat-containing protein [Salmonella enterica]|uniref:hemagglutinin repeat-containing protein n=1 Tax=Salmonella enterica TaxID=28901 RepID=UPI003D31AC8E|nr:hemagglutinin repeat-containing protein [Salmonella enterica]
MNRLFYRLIFNAARQMVMVVSDITRSHRAGPASSGENRVEKTVTSRIHWSVRPVVTTLWLTLGMVTFSVSASDIRADGSAPGNQQPTIVNTQNGLPQVNIQTPNHDGVSRNQYSQFDVDQKGAILNNSSTHINTQLGGIIQGNEWLAKGEAKIILNEVNSHDPSQLNGFIEVAGKKADVVIANPSGITCNGCGFINADKALLSAGKTLIENGKIKGFEVDKGNINIVGKGYNGHDTNYTALIARSVNINARLHAKDLVMTTGKNTVAADGHTVLNTASSSEDKPEFALDVAALGGMYANTIRMRGTEHGVGVRNAGHIGAEAGNITLSADGKIGNAGVITASQNVVLGSQQSINNTGTVLAQNDIQLSAKQAITHTDRGQIVAGRDATLVAGQITSDTTTLLAAGVDNKGQLTSAGSLTVKGDKDVILQGENVAKTSLTVTGGELDLSHSSTRAKNIALTSAAADIRTQEAYLLATNNATLIARRGIDNQKGEVVAEQLTLSAPEFIENQQGKLVQKGYSQNTLNTQVLNNLQGEISFAGDTVITGSQLNNQSGTLLSRDGNVDIQIKNLNNQQGTILAAGNQGLTIKADKLDGQKGEILTRGTLSLTGQSINLNQGTTQAEQITLKASELSHRQGNMLQTGDNMLSVDMTALLDNQGGSLASSGDLRLQAGRVDNTDGKLLTATNHCLDLTSATEFNNTHGVVQTDKYLMIKAGKLLNPDGKISSLSGSALLTASHVEGEKGTLFAQDALRLESEDINLNQSFTQANQISVFANNLSHQGATLLQTGEEKTELHIQHQLDNLHGEISSHGKMDISAGTLNNPDGKIIAAKSGHLTLNIQQVLNNTQGTLFGEQGIQLLADRVINPLGKIIARSGNNQLTLNQLDGEKGEILSTGKLVLTGDNFHLNEATTQAGNIHIQGQSLSHQRGQMLQTGREKGEIKLAQTLDNQSGNISSPGTLNLEVNTLENLQGVVVAANEGELILNAKDRVDNTQGTLFAGQSLTLDTHAFTNIDGKTISQQGNLKIDTESLLGERGELAAQGDLSLSGQDIDLSAANTQAQRIQLTANNLTHQQGTMTQLGEQQGILEVSRYLNNTAGNIRSNGAWLIKAHTLDNPQGHIFSAKMGQLDLHIQQALDNTGGTLTGRQGIFVETPSLINRSGHVIASLGDVTLNGQSLDGDEGEILAKGTLNIQGETLSLNQAVTQGERILITANTLEHQKGKLLQTGTDAGEINLQGQLNNLAGEMGSNGDFTLKASTLNNNDGQIITVNKGHLSVALQDTLTNKKGVIAGDDGLDIAAGQLNNLQGKVVARHGDTTLDITRDINNQAGLIAAEQLLQMSNQALQNALGYIQASILNINTRNQRVDNTQGSLLAQQTLTLNSGLIENQQGSIQSGRDMQIDTHGAALNNTLSGEGKGIYSQGKMALNTGELDNAQGRIVAKAQLTLNSLALKNHQGVTGSQSALSLTTQQLDNREGIITGRSVNIDTQGQRLINTAKTDEQGIFSSQELALTVGEFINRQGHIQAENMTLETRKNRVDNTDGEMLAVSHFTANTGGLDNQRGRIQAGKQLALNSHGDIVNNSDTQKSGGLLSGGNLTFNSGQLINQQGQIQSADAGSFTSHVFDNQQGQIYAGGLLTVDTQQRALLNQNGTLASEGKIALTTGVLNNQQGLVQGRNGVNIDAEDIDNLRGVLLSPSAVQVTGAALNNREGTVQSQGNADLTIAKNIDNQDGQILSGASITIRNQQLHNTRGTLLGLKDVLVTATQWLDNQQGRVKANNHLTVTSPTIENADTAQAGNGLEGQNVTLNATEISNQSGAIRAGQRADVVVAQSLNNTQGMISAGTQLHVSDNAGGNALTLSNPLGVMVSNGDTAISANQLTGEGKLIAQEALSLTLSQPFENTGRIQAGAHLDAHVAQGLTNNGLISSLNELVLTTGTVINQVSGEISGQNTRIKASGQVLNTGLIDGVLTHIVADALDNLGTGRIYGDDLAIGVSSLLNDKQSGKSAVIAGRHSVNLAVSELLNRDHALIYSDGDLSIGNQLNDQLQATGQATSVKNHSAGIEADGRLTLKTGFLENKDIHLQLTEQPVEVSREHFDWFDFGNGHRYKIQPQKGNEDRYAINDDGTLNKAVGINYESHKRWRMFEYGNWTKNFYEYDYDRIVSETQVLNHDPALITSGQDLIIDGPHLNNENARIVAGQNLILKGSVLNNEDAPGIRRIAEEGKTIYRYKDGGKWSTHSDVSAYQGVNRDEALPLHLLEVKEHTDSVSKPRLDAVKVNTPVGSVADVLVSALKENPGIPLPDVALNAGNDTPLVLSVGQQMDVTPLPVMSARLDVSDARPIVPSLQVNEANVGQGTDIQVLMDNVSKREDVTAEAVPQGKDNPEIVIRTVGPDIRLPDNSLFIFTPASDSQFLTETDPRFTHYKKWLSSLDIVTNEQLHKRLGDGFYEQRLVRDQLIATTGQRLSGSYRNDEEQYRALLMNGVAFGRQFHLTPGIALSPEQMAYLTTDMVWMVNKEVTLPDGRVEQVSVPQVYVRVRPGDLKGNGALIAGRNVAALMTDNILNSGEISSRELSDLRAEHIENRGRIQGKDVQLSALKDIRHIGGEIRGLDSVSLSAGRDIFSETEQGGKGTSTWLARPAGIYVTGDDGRLTLKAVQDINLIATDIGNSGMDGKTSIIAGRDIRSETREIGSAFDYTHNSHNYYRGADRTEVGTQIQTQGDLTLLVGQDLSARAANVASGGKLAVSVGRDIHLATGVESHDYAKHTKHTDKGFLSKSTTETHDETHDQQAVSTTLSGDSVSLQASNNISVHGSNVAGTQDVSLVAGNNLDITTARESHQESHLKQEKKSGLMSSGGIGFTIGSSSQKSTAEGQGETQLGSTLGSQQGNLTLSAGHDTTVHGSDLVAGGDISLSGQNVNITAAENSQTTLQKFESHQSGVTVALSGAVGAALNTTVQNVKQARQTQDGRLQALGGVKAALSGIQATQAMELNNAQQAAQQAGSGEAAPAAFGVTASLGSQSSKSEQKTESHTVSGSSLNAGHDIHIRATGDGQGHGGDILVQGSQVKAAHDIYLDAQRDIQLLSALNTETLSGKNSSHGGSVGVGINVGQNTGITVSASVNAAKGHENGTTLTHTNTTLDAGHHVTLNAGRDATLKGAQVSGEKITADVKRNLTLQSEQDSDHYDSKQQSASAGASYTWGAGGPSASVSLSQDKIHSNFDSVKDQTGLFAGKEGFDVTTGQHTQLDGAVIASTADKSKNRLDTGTLGFSDIHNQADFTAQHQGISVGTGGSVGSQLLTNMATNTLSGVNKSGHESSTTHAAVSDGSLIVRNTADQKQDTSTLSRDTEHAANGLSPIFDKEKVQRQLQQAQMVSDISSQVLDIYNTYEAINATRKATEDMQNAFTRQDARTLAEKELRAEKDKHPSVTVDEETITKRAYQNLYNKALEKNEARLGDPMRQAVTASVAVLSGLAGGDIKAALANGAAPYLATGLKLITGKDTPSDEQMAIRLLGHAIIGGVVAELSGAPAAGGAVGAVSGEVAAITISKLYFGKPPSELNESEREQLSGMSTIVAALAGSLASGSSAGTIAGAQAGKNAVENNYLSYDEAHAFDREMTACRKAGRECGDIQNKYAVISADNRLKLHIDVAADPLTALSGEDKWNIEGGLSAAGRPGWLYGSLKNQDVKDYVTEGNSYDLNYLNSNTSQGDRALAFFGEPENYWGTVAGAGSLLTSSATLTEKFVSAGLSYGANGAVQVATGNTGEKFDYLSFMMSGLTGVGTAGKGYYANQLLGAGSAYMSSQIEGQDSTASVVGSMAGTGIGYNVGASITNKFESQYIKNQLGMDASKNALKYSESSFGPGYLFKGGEMSPYPGIAGGFIGSGSSELSSSAVQEKTKGVNK